MYISLSLPLSGIEARKMEPRIYQVINLMTIDLEREIPLDKLAQAVNLSASRLRHLFKEETGISPAQYLKVQRLKKAKQLLETTFLNLKEVMYLAGFRNRSHFTIDFRNAYRLAPLQYRRQYLIAKQKKQTRSIARTVTR
jgi:AraC family transcriptional regulator of arabinose operon